LRALPTSRIDTAIIKRREDELCGGAVAPESRHGSGALWLIFEFAHQFLSTLSPFCDKKGEQYEMAILDKIIIIKKSSREIIEINKITIKT
jgi:hypothetical protein